MKAILFDSVLVAHTSEANVSFAVYGPPGYPRIKKKTYSPPVSSLPSTLCERGSRLLTGLLTALRAWGGEGYHKTLALVLTQALGATRYAERGRRTTSGKRSNALVTNLLRDLNTILLRE